MLLLLLLLLLLPLLLLLLRLPLLLLLLLLPLLQLLLFLPLLPLLLLLLLRLLGDPSAATTPQGGFVRLAHSNMSLSAPLEPSQEEARPCRLAVSRLLSCSRALLRPQGNFQRVHWASPQRAAKAEVFPW